MNTRKLISLIITLAVALGAWFAPSDIFGIQGLTIVEHRVIAIFFFAALMWITEVIPIWTTSVLVITILLLTVSDSSIWFMHPAPEDVSNFGTVVKYKALMASFADPIIMLFLGGFVLAIGSAKCNLDKNLARVLFKPFGTRSEIVLLGMMFVTAVFSMFMSNTATTAMMFAVMAPLLAPLGNDGGKGRTAMTLAIPVAANIGGIGTPIGTPPNAIVLKYLNDPDGMNLGIGFGQWMMYMVPFVFILLFITWLVMIKMFPFHRKNLELNFDCKFEKSTKAYIIYATFAITVLLWMFDRVTGLNSNVVAMIPIAVFCATGVIDKNDLKTISWDVLWLVAGGFALGVALQGTGLAKSMVNSIPFATWQPVVTVVGAGLICYAMSTFMSHTATSALLVPILAAVAVGMGEALAPYGGASTLLIGVAMSSSLAMALPISTPPNAIAHSAGLTTQKEMATVGLIVALFGLTMTYVMLLVLGKYNLL